MLFCNAYNLTHLQLTAFLLHTAQSMHIFTYFAPSSDSSNQRDYRKRLAVNFPIEINCLIYQNLFTPSFLQKEVNSCRNRCSILVNLSFRDLDFLGPPHVSQLSFNGSVHFLSLQQNSLAAQRT